MKKIGSQLFAELKKKATHFVWAFKVTRADGVVMGFTSSDEAFDFEGVTYKPANGFTGMAAAAKNNLSVDNITVASLLTAEVPEVDLRAGKFDDAHVRIFWVCPETLHYGAIPIRGGRFGEITIRNADFEVELRSAAWFLQQPFGKFFALECTAQFGDGDCKVNLNPTIWKSGTGYVARAGADAGIGSWVKPTRENGFWYWCVSAHGQPSTVAANPAWTQVKDETSGGAGGTGGGLGGPYVFPGQTGDLTGAGVGGGAISDGGFQTTIEQSGVDVTGSFVNSEAYLKPTKQYAPPASAPYGLQPLTITTHSMQLVLSMGWSSGGAEPTWPTTAGATVSDGDLVWKAYPARVRDGIVTAVFNKGEFEDANMNSAPHFFQYGLIEWLSGRNAGFKMEVRDFLYDPRPSFFLLEQMPFLIQVGDRYRVTVGCNKTRPMCKTVFENINNMRAQPDMPTEDRALATPNFTQQGTQSDPNHGGGS